MIATCTQCPRMFETTEEDANDPDRLCRYCYHDRQKARVMVIDELRRKQAADYASRMAKEIK